MLLNPAEWCRIGNIGRVCYACATREDADDTTIGVSNNRPRISTGGERTIPFAV